MLWKFEGRPAYLQASVNAQKKPTVFSEAAANAIAQAKALVFEADLTKPGALDAGVYQDTRRLSRKLSPETFLRLQKRWSEAGLPLSKLDAMQPLAAHVTLERALAPRRGLRVENGIDQAVMARGDPKRQTLVHLEDAGAIYVKADSVPEAELVARLEYTVMHTRTVLDDIEAIADAFATGDLAAVGACVREDAQRFPTLHAYIFENRHRAWQRGIAHVLGKGAPAIFTIGVTHLVGPGNLIEVMAAEGLAMGRLE